QQGGAQARFGLGVSSRLPSSPTRLDLDPVQAFPSSLPPRLFIPCTRSGRGVRGLVLGSPPHPRLEGALVRPRLGCSLLLRSLKSSMAKLKPKALLAQSKVKKGPSQISVTTIFTYLVLGVIVVSSVYAAYKYWVGKGPAVTAAGVEGN
ncbi:unnamed protein product, partial [Urochloa humidicola]